MTPDKHKKNQHVPLFVFEYNNIELVPIENAIIDLYHGKSRIPTKYELVASNINTEPSEIQHDISKTTLFIPLYDAYTTNIYIIQKRNVYIRVIRHNYRFPDALILKSLKSLLKKKISKIENKPEIQNDMVYMRSIRKIKLMIEFMAQFDIDTLFQTYLNYFHHYSPDLHNATYTCIRRSFMPHKDHLDPYYSVDEVLKIALNLELVKLPPDTSYIDYKDSLTRKNYKNICSLIQSNDVSSEILLKHQNYIIEQNLVGLIQYYTIQGSYFMNQYLRGKTKYEYRNDYLENNIKKVWTLVLNAPTFDNNYTLYRFINTDDFLRNIKIGEVFKDAGFMSTTRDPFYDTKQYKFGFILIKIKIPKNIIGVGLCLETMSHFAKEEEIILPPLTELKLIKKDNNCVYYHPEDSFVANIKTRYEFVWVGNSKVKLMHRPELPLELQTKNIDFLTIKRIRMMSLKEKVDHLMKTEFDPMNRILCMIGNNKYYVVGEYYDSTGAYASMYKIKTNNGFSMYSIYEGYMLFMIEIGEVDGDQQIRVNYYTKYSRLNRQEIMGDENFIRFISTIAHYFEIPSVVIYADFMSCDRFENTTNKMSRSVNTKITNNCNECDGASNRAYLKSLAKQKRSSISDNISSDIDTTKLQDTNNVYDDAYSGGSYCLDFYKYFKYNIKRYHANNTSLNTEMQSAFSYRDLDEMKRYNPIKILNQTDRDELYQIYIKTYITISNKETNNLASFYIWMIENRCYLMDIFIHKLNRIYPNTNPFKKTYYILDSIAYLYNRRIVQSYNRSIKMIINEEHQLLELPKNAYRIQR